MHTFSRTQNNPLLADFLGHLLDHCLRLHFALRSKSYVRIALKETSLLIDALEKKDPDLAEKLARQHFARSRQQLLLEMEQEKARQIGRPAAGKPRTFKAPQQEQGQ